MNLQEIDNKTLEQLRADHADIAVLLTSPFCGTCQVAEKMLTVVQAAKPTYSLYKINANFIAQQLEQWQITTVPALLIFKQGNLHETLLTMYSVSYLYEKLQ
ncbi:thioredoxin family protein [Paenibacillus yanchengensis]|uniref:Thioredoxin family protein n=1 Tax=Paenibacillus yanchengensis TaxID=2035833 RepID=A0ABW4YLT1_9BACL